MGREGVCPRVGEGRFDLRFCEGRQQGLDTRGIELAADERQAHLKRRLALDAPEHGDEGLGVRPHRTDRDLGMGCADGGHVRGAVRDQQRVEGFGVTNQRRRQGRAGAEEADQAA